MTEKKQIIVIADDFTGAAEIGGIGLRHGLKVAIEPDPTYNPTADLLVVATDTRSMAPKDAVLRIKEITNTLVTYKPFLIYKKVDSVLRGNVTEELEAQMNAMGLNRSLIIAANPVFKRIIKNGYYYIDDVPLHETSFSKDRQRPISSNKVLEFLTPSEKYPVVSMNFRDNLPHKGMILGDVETLEDLKGWTRFFDERSLLAGASGFFNALLSSFHIPRNDFIPNTYPFRDRALFILGSAFPKDEQVMARMKENGHHIINMPESIYYNKKYPEDDFNGWVNNIADGIKKYQKVIVTCSHYSTKDPGIFIKTKRLMARMAKEVIERVELDEILIEGGSTTSEILNTLRIEKLTPIQELGVGVIRMKIEGMKELCLTTKPGSYCWPENVWMRDEIIKMNNKKVIAFTSYG